MKNKIIFALLGSIVFMTCWSQTPEEVAGQKMLDSIMRQMPENQRAMMQQMMQMGKDADAKRKQQKEKSRKQEMAKNKASKKQNEMEFYWRNTIASNTQGKFENWSYGQVEIRTSYRGRDKKKREMKIGSISENGQVTINLPEIDRLTVNPMGSAQHESERLVGNPYLELDYSNKNTGYLSTRHNVNAYSGEENIGFIHIGNSIKPVVNLNAPCCLHKAGDGYTAYWVYTSQTNRIAGVKITEDRNGDEGKIVCDLNFQPGWNLIMERVEGTREKSSESWKNQYYTATTTLAADAKYYFTSNQ